MSELKPCEVIQADRDAAADVLKKHYMGTWNTDGIRSGECDSGEHVQAFARHRIASTRPEPTTDFNTWRTRLDPNGLLDGYELARAYAEVRATVPIDCSEAYLAGEKTYRNLLAIQEKTGRMFSPAYISMAVVQDAIRSLPTGDAK